MKKFTKKIINKIGNSKFAEKFVNDYVDTTGHKIALGLIVLLTVAFCGLFYFAPLLRFSTDLVIPEWMVNPVLEDASMISLQVLLVYAAFVAFIGHCHANSYYNEAEVCEEICE